jgi:hypothetical protein
MAYKIPVFIKFSNRCQFLFCRKREERLGRLHQEEIDSITTEHLSETKALVDEFNRAKELQNSKISALHLM